MGRWVDAYMDWACDHPVLGAAGICAAIFGIIFFIVAPLALLFPDTTPHCNRGIPLYEYKLEGKINQYVFIGCRIDG